MPSTAAIIETAATASAPAIFKPSLLGGDADDHFEGGARRINAGNGLMVERLLFVEIVSVEIALADTVDEEIGIEARRRGHHQQVAVMDIHDDGRARLLAEILHGGALQLMIERQHQARAALRFAPFAFVLALLYAARVDNDLAIASAPVQRRLHRGFEPGLADAHVRIAQIHRAALALFGILKRAVDVALRRLLHVADRVRVDDVIGIGAHIRRRGDDAAQLRQAHIDGVELFPGQPFLQRLRLIARTSAHADDGAARPFGVVTQDQRDLADHLFHVLDVVLHDRDLIILAGLGEDSAEAIIDDPARRRDDARVEAVFIGRVAVFLADQVRRLQLTHADEDRAQHADADERQKRRAAREDHVRVALGERGAYAFALHRRCPERRLADALM